MGRQYGYVRVSTAEQNEGRQLKKLEAHGVDPNFIFVDKASGKDFDRPQYQNMRRFIQEGDLIYIDALDRLGRNYDEIIKEWKHITRERGADIVILENEALFDSRKFKSMDDMGKLMEDQFLSLLSYVAEQERKKIRQRQKEGIALAKAQGRHLGRPKSICVTDEFVKYYIQWKAGAITATQAIELAEMSRAGFYRLVKEYEGRA